MNIEPLESRIAPATLVNPTTLIYTDIDGDLVTVKTSAGAFVFTNPPNGTGFVDTFVFTPPNASGGQQLQLVDLRQGSGFENAILTFSVVNAGDGDGLAAVGLIYAPGIDLGTVTVKGDLGEIDCGDGDTATPGLKALNVRSMGRYGDANDSLIPGVTSDISGALGMLRVAEDMRDASINVTATVDADAKIGNIFIGGSLLGGAVDGSGRIQAEGEIGPVTIGRNLVGGAGSDTGQIEADGKIGAVSIGGSVVGAAGAGSGQIDSGGDLTSLRIGGNLVGGTGFDSGLIIGRADLGPVTIGGSMLGGADTFSGSLLATGDIGPVKIAHDVRGGDGADSGKIDAGGTIKSLSIAGSLLGGGGDYSTPGHSAQIWAVGDIGAVKIGHDVAGGDGVRSAHIRSDSGRLVSVSIGGSLVGGHMGVESARIFGKTGLGAVTIGGDLVGTTAQAGVVDSDGPIASVTIGGSLVGGHDVLAGYIHSGGLLGPVRIAHDVIGGTSGGNCGAIRSDAGIVSVTIGGSLFGGSASFSGALISDLGSIGPVKIGHDLVGGSIAGASPTLDHSGAIEAAHRIASVFVGGSIIAGTDGSTGGDLTANASIRAGDDLGSLTVMGSLVGNIGSEGDSLVVISARGQATPGAKADVAIGKISIGKRVEHARIFAGWDAALVPKNADAQVGAVSVGGDWVVSSLVVGAINLGLDDAPGGGGSGAADNVSFANGHDFKITGGTDTVNRTSKIGSLTIAGLTFGSPIGAAGSFRSFGFVAEEFGAVKFGGAVIPLTPGAGNDGRLLSLTHFGSGLFEIGATFLALPAPTASAKLINASTVTYDDLDGDHVTVKFSKPLLTTGNVNTIFTFDTGMVDDGINARQQLQRINLTDLDATGVSITVTVAPGGGDRLANIGAMAAASDLGSVTIPGDLGQIDTGDPDPATRALAALTVRTMGRFRLDTQPPTSATFTPSLESKIDGGLGMLTVKQDFVEARLEVTGAIGPVNIGGSLIGAFDFGTGAIVTTGAVGAVKIGQHVQAGVGGASGQIDAGKSIASLTVGGSVIGGLVNADGTTLGAVKIAHNVIGGIADFTGRLSANTGFGGFTLGGSLLGGIGKKSAQIFVAAGPVGAVTIGHNFAGGSGDESGKIDVAGKLSSVTIAGSLVGGGGDYETTAHHGQIFSVGDMGAVKIARDLHGGSGNRSGAIASMASLTSVTLGGSLVGGTASLSGSLEAKNLGAVKIGRDLIGGDGGGAGYLEGFDSIVSVTVGGSLVGGAGPFDGAIYTGGTLGPVKIGHDQLGGAGGDAGGITGGLGITSATIGGSLAGGSAVRAGSIIGGNLGAVKIGRDILGGRIAGTAPGLDKTGYIESAARIAAVTVGGSMISGSDDSTVGSLTRNASVRAGDDIGSLTVKGSLIGNVAQNGTSLVVISARGQAVPLAGKDLAIGRITIGGGVERANLFAGYDLALTPVNDGVQVGAVTVSHDWIASNLVCGVQNFGADGDPGGSGPAADNVNFGDASDVTIGAGGFDNRIAAIIIKGIVVGTASGADHFGFSSIQIGSFKSLNFIAALTAATAKQIIQLSPITGDATVRET